MSIGTNIAHTRAYNRRVVLDLLRRRGPLSRTDLAECTSLTLQGVSNIMATLLDEGLVVNQGRRQGGRGQPPIEFALNPSGAFAVGISFELDRIVATSMNVAGEIGERIEVEVEGTGPEEGIDQIVLLATRLTESLSPSERKRVAGVGVALPAVVDGQAGKPVRMVSRPEWEGFPVRDALASRLGVSVQVANDAVLASLGEHWYGTGASFDNFFFILISKGFGSSLIQRGEPSGGIWGVSGRMGHIPVEPNGKFCPSCGETGCLSLYTSLNSLHRELSEHGVEVTRMNELTSLYEEGNEVLGAWLERSARYLARGLVTLENLIVSQAIVFGGRIPDPLLRDLTERVSLLYNGRPVKSPTSLPRLMISRSSADGVVLGAATLPLYLNFAPNFGFVLNAGAVLG